ncbi:PREDICTED: uncharacterized protein LOC108353880, partial [Rhagoletis zephyria]|uniref:uncharacterized protein LOC108353880 n=1 Tax=Rhagoletis zephyria TaxID=28612 RepID=UPI0008115DAF
MWDEELPPHLATQWITWWSKFQSVKSLSIHRCYSSFIPNADDIQLHIFVDASTSAYASAAYLRVQKGDTVEVALVCAKAACAPLKTTTVPRLELQAAVMGCRIKSLIEESLDITINKTLLWSDSQTVILWIRSHTRAYKPYVAHRIAEILTTTTIDQWRWLPTAMNVADDATRAQPSLEFSQHTRWFKGPDFLQQAEECWPRETTLTPDERANKEETSRCLLACNTDDSGLLRVYGRIDAAYCLPLAARRPIILPGSHYVAGLVVADHHRERHHQNDNLVMNEIRQRYWVTAIRGTLKNVKRHCPVCIHERAKPADPLMGQLPKDRLTPYVRPFSYCGVDYCGPFNVAIGRRREKRWIALFTCLTTRAVHLELAENLSTDAFILCLRNFVNRRGVPIRIRSDNGTNFVGAQKEINQSERLFDFDAIEREMSRRKIEW